MAPAPEPDKVGELVRGLKLDMTFLQGRAQHAVINGRIYSRGQRIELPGRDATSDRSLQVLAVTRTSVSRYR